MTVQAKLSAIEAALQHVAEAAAADRWTLTTTPTPESRREGWTVHLESKSGRGAPVRVHGAESLPILNVMLGEGGMIELLPEQGNDDAIYSELADIVEVAVQGRYSETLWYAGDRLVRSRGLLNYGDHNEVTRYRDLLPSLTSPSRREERRYKPY